MTARIFLMLIALLGAVGGLRAEEPEIPNRLIDAQGFREDVENAHTLRAKRRVTEEEFIALAKDAMILDARPRARYDMMHIAGARHLEFADFTEGSLRAAIPSKETRILIYCNNNIEGAEDAFPSKMERAALNLSTFVSLYSYGYRNVYELGPVISPASSKIKFEGSSAPSR